MILERLKPEEKVNLSINIIDVCVRICADSLKDQDETIKEEELLEKVRARTMYQKRRHYEVQKVDWFEGLIRRIVNNFNIAGIDYAFTGAVAGSCYRTPGREA